MDPAISEPAHAMAIDWVRRGMDHNEVAKVATYLHSHLRANDFFEFLETLATDSDFLERSRQTARYFRDIQDVCNQHLGSYRNGSLERTREMSQILGWAVRLMHYYEGVGVPAAERLAPAEPIFTATLEDYKQRQEDALRTAASAASTLGVTKKREAVTLCENAKKGKASVETTDGERVACSGLPAYPPARKGMQCRADVTRDGGKPKSAVFKGWE